MTTLAIILALTALGGLYYIYMIAFKKYKTGINADLAKDVSTFKDYLVKELNKFNKQVENLKFEINGNKLGVVRLVQIIVDYNRMSLDKSLNGSYLKKNETYANALKELVAILTDKFIKVDKIQTSANSVTVSIPFGSFSIKDNNVTVKGEAKTININKVRDILSTK